MKKNFLTVIALLTVFALALAGCGKEEAPETTVAPTTVAVTEAAPELGLSDWSMSATTWSSPNGATIHLNATPLGYAEGYSAAMIVRLEGEDVANVPCDWDGTHYTASVELNAADGYCYYILMTAADGNTMEEPLNTPTAPIYESFINMESSLSAYCSVIVESHTASDSKLTITGGTAQVQAPKITNNNEVITVSEAVLNLMVNGESVASEKLKLEETDEMGAYQADLANVSFKVPELDADQPLILTLDVELSNGQALSATGGTFFYIDGDLLTAVG